MAIYANDLYEYTITQHSTIDRSVYCTELTSNLFKDITTKLYSESYTMEYRRYFEGSIIEIFDKIRKTFDTSLDSVPWIPDGDKTKMSIKLNTLHLKFYSDNNTYLNDNYLNDKYKSFDLEINNFQKNLYHVLNNQRKYYYGLMQKEFNDDVL